MNPNLAHPEEGLEDTALPFPKPVYATPDQAHLRSAHLPVSDQAMDYPPATVEDADDLASLPSSLGQHASPYSPAAAAAPYPASAPTRGGRPAVEPPVRTPSFHGATMDETSVVRDDEAAAAAAAAVPARVFTADELGCPLRSRILGIGGLVFFLSLAIIAFFVGTSTAAASSDENPNATEVVLFTWNDFYEPNPIAGRGGVARVAQLKKDLQKKNPNLISLFAGDFFSPSALNTVILDDVSPAPAELSTTWTPLAFRSDDDTDSGVPAVSEGDGPLNGKHLIDSINRVGTDVATLGNHEFDFSEQLFRSRLAMCEFPILATNVGRGAGAESDEPFPNFRKSMIITRGDVRFAIVSLSINSNVPKYVTITGLDDGIAAARAELDALRKAGETWDVLIILSHVEMYDDVAILDKMPEADLVIGGHDHDHVIHSSTTAGSTKNKRTRVISKADFNALSVYVHRIKIDLARIRAAADSPYGSVANAPRSAITKGGYQIDSELVHIVDSLPEEPGVVAAVADWTDRAFAALEADGMKPRSKMCTLAKPIDFNLKTVRYNSCVANTILAGAVLRAGEVQQRADAAVASDESPRVRARHAKRREARPIAALADLPPAEFGLANSGSYRLEGSLPEGTRTQYDAMRVLPFGGSVWRVNATGAVISTAMERAAASKGSGEFMAYDASEFKRLEAPTTDGVWWSFNGEPLQGERVYTFNVNDYLRSGSPVFDKGAALVDLSDHPIAENLQLVFADEMQRLYPIQEDVAEGMDVIRGA